MCSKARLLFKLVPCAVVAGSSLGLVASSDSANFGKSVAELSSELVQRAAHWVHWICAYSEIHIHKSEGPAHGRRDFELLKLAASEVFDTTLLPRPQIDSLTEAQLEDRLRHLLRHLPTSGIDGCSRVLTATALIRRERAAQLITPGSEGSELSPAPEAPGKGLNACLTALSHVVQNTEHCSDVLQLGAVEDLMLVANNCDVKSTLRLVATCICHASRSTEVRHRFLHSGWVYQLRRWLYDDDVMLSLLAATALRNLDPDHTPLDAGVYCVQPLLSNDGEYDADIVFVHGLNGSAFRTWRQCDREPRLDKGEHNTVLPLHVRHTSSGELKQRLDRALDVDCNSHCEPEQSYTHCWPMDWLGPDLPRARIWLVDYETYYSTWSMQCAEEIEERSLSARSSHLLQCLRCAGLGSRPVVWVGHSMGGLLIKQMLLDCEEVSESLPILNQTRAVLFLSTPHRGSSVEQQLGSLQYVIYPSQEARQLAHNSSDLLRLHSRFRSMLASRDMHVLSLAESQRTPLQLGLNALIVPPESADPGLGSFIQLDTNHMYICKPNSKHSLLFRLIKDFVQFALYDSRVSVNDQASFSS